MVIIAFQIYRINDRKSLFSSLTYNGLELDETNAGGTCEVLAE